jgi:uncharacterized membrane protein
MKMHPITRQDLWLAEGALGLAILLQLAVGAIGPGLTYGPQALTVMGELALAVIIYFSASLRHLEKNRVHRPLSLLLLGLLSAANISSFVLVARLLVTPGSHLSGPELLISAIAIFLTNIIVFALWYWEIDSPGLSGKKWSKHDKDFQFIQQDLVSDFPHWRPSLFDYLYLSVTNAINFAPADTRPLTAAAKGLMATQALVSVFTLALVLARSVSVLGQ